MEHFSYSIAPEIFEKFPGYVRGVVIAHQVTNGPSSPELVQLMREAEASVRARVNVEQIAEEPHIKAWREAYRAFGAKPSEFRSKPWPGGPDGATSCLPSAPWSTWATLCRCATCCRPAPTPSTC
jgi:hypothetical protein